MSRLQLQEPRGTCLGGAPQAALRVSGQRAQSLDSRPPVRCC